jgi:hypothetical protein
VLTSTVFCGVPGHEHAIRFPERGNNRFSALFPRTGEPEAISPCRRQNAVFAYSGDDTKPATGVALHLVRRKAAYPARMNNKFFRSSPA